MPKWMKPGFEQRHEHRFSWVQQNRICKCSHFSGVASPTQQLTRSAYAHIHRSMGPPRLSSSWPGSMGLAPRAEMKQPSGYVLLIADPQEQEQNKPREHIASHWFVTFTDVQLVKAKQWAKHISNRVWRKHFPLTRWWEYLLNKNSNYQLSHST